MKNKKNNILGIFLIFLILAVAINFVSAIGLSKDYYEGNPVKIAPGEIKEVVFGQIIVTQEEGDRNIELELTEGSDIAEIIGEKSFIAKAGSRDNFIKININIPEDIPEGKIYNIVMKVKDLTVPVGGMVGFTTSTTSSIPVLVEKQSAEQPAGTSSVMIWILVIVIIIASAILVWFFMFRKKTTEKKNFRK